ncbi:hypothetical protein Misp01_58460 [Microtetraspora sp. NBRC 13810]|uniref:DUF6461 domain-containing protein n=1 Tax=Microtetraspora sp. NBRC 13810 TaxID=3030990 RepID=UPI0024A0BE3D|nr:DUF6461 domain-containing protein [Microtetraspora sp. NBRC 13810]GLW10718.1 hypothetical protein Misp01_58460 [Microtetraspora sp. NBRC 13810]
MAEEELKYYRKLLDTHYVLRGNTCTSWTRIPDVTAVASCFGDLVDPVGKWTLLHASEYRDEHDPSSVEEQDPIVLLDTRSRWTIAIEPDGREATAAEVMRRLSAGGEAFCIFGGGSPEWQYSRDGGKPLRVKHIKDDEPDVRVLGALIGDLPCREDSSGENWLEAAYTLAERITGVRLGDAWLREPHDGYIIRKTTRDVLPENLRDHPILLDPEIAAIAADPHGHRRKVVELSARVAVEVTGLGSEVIRDALAAASSRLVPAELWKQVQELALQSGRHDLLGTLSAQTAAFNALLGALDPNDRRAAGLASHWASRIEGGTSDQRARLAVLQACAKYL